MIKPLRAGFSFVLGVQNRSFLSFGNASEKASQKRRKKCRKSVAKVSQKCRKSVAKVSQKASEKASEKASRKRRKSVDHGFVQGLRSCPCSSFVACFDERFASTFAG
jgi:hypothetical protein